MSTALRGRVLPSDAFAVVMATGIVSVAARSNGLSAVSAVLAVLAVGALAVLCALAALRWATTGRAFADEPDPVTRTFGLFTFVAAVDVVDTRVSHGRTGIAVALGLIALAACLVVVARLVVALRSVPRGSRRDSARGNWLLAAVAAASLALTAAQLARGGTTATRPLIVASLAWWVLALLAYVVLAGIVLRRLWAARFAPDVLTPDAWVLMGAPAIATLSGSALSLASVESGVFGWLPGLLHPTLLAVWLLGTGLIPLLLAGEIRRARQVPVRYERGRWATVFPLGMYSSACSLAATALAADGERAAALPAVLHEASAAAFWTAFAAWCATAVGVARLGWRGARVSG